MLFQKKYTKGFTLIEFIITIAIIVVLSSMVILAINPISQMRKARNNQRDAHVNAIYLSLMEYRSREGDFPACVTSTPSDVYACLADLVPTYIASLPEDPDSGCEYQTGYFVKKSDATGRVGVSAQCAEDGLIITTGTWE